MDLDKLFRQMTHLVTELGEEHLAALIDSDNTGKVRELCYMLMIPKRMRVGGYVFGIQTFCPQFWTWPHLDHPDIIKAAAHSGACFGQEDALLILEYEKSIPLELRRSTILFANWRHHSVPDMAAFIFWNGECWTMKFDRIDTRNCLDRRIGPVIFLHRIS